MSILDQVLEVSTGPRIVNQQNDINQISFDATQIDRDAQSRIDAISPGGWDASEYGITREQAIALVERERTPEARARAIDQLRQRAIRRADLYTNETGKVCVYTYQDLPWHGLGTTLDGIVTWRDACAAAGMSDWNLQKVAATVDWNGQALATGLFAVVRQDVSDPAKAVVGEGVGKCYTIVPNEKAFQFMDQLVKDGQTIFESAGVLDNGKAIWIQTRRPTNFDVAGDQMYRFDLYTARHDGTGSIWIHPTCVRDECANTNRLAARDRKHGLSIRHTGDINRKLADVRSKLGYVDKQEQAFREQAATLASKQLAPVEYFQACLDDILDVTIAGQPLTSKTVDDRTVLNAILDIADVEKKATEEKRYERALRNRTKLFEDIMDRYESERNNGNPRIAGTAWSAWNAVTEYADHGRRYRGSTQQRAENRLVSTIMGGQADVIKQSALDRALSTVA